MSFVSAYLYGSANLFASLTVDLIVDLPVPGSEPQVAFESQGGRGMFKSGDTQHSPLGNHGKPDAVTQEM